jgi:cell division protein FtsQ
VFLPWMRRFGVALAAFVLVLWLGAWLVMSGTMARGKNWLDNAVLMATRDMGFKVDNIMVEGREHADPQTLLALINVQKGDPLFSFDPAAAQDLISGIGWVRSARIERRWPGTIYIGLTERVPLALWQQDKKQVLLDTDGHSITSEGLKEFAGLPVVIGEDAPAHAADLISSLKAEPSIAARLKAASRIGGRRWDLLMDNGVLVRLPEEDMPLALSTLARAQEQDAILQKPLESIDLREAGRLIVQTRPGAVEEYKASLTGGAKPGSSI